MLVRSMGGGGMGTGESESGGNETEQLIHEGESHSVGTNMGVAQMAPTSMFAVLRLWLFMTRVARSLM